MSRALPAALLLLLVSACTSQPQAGPDPTSDPAPGMDESLRTRALALVRAREDALATGDRDAFLATVDSDNEDFASSQARWWDNLAQLPVTDVALELGDEEVMTRVHGEGDLQLPVDFTMRLDGYDDHPVTQPLVYTFVAHGDDVRLTSDRNIQNDALTGWIPAPWDVTAVTVEESDGVLAVFDDTTRDDASSLQDDIVAARDAIEPLLPPWSGRVVAIDIADVGAIDKMTSMQVDQTAGVAFPVARRPGARTASAYRFAVNPGAYGSGYDRDRVFRHELVHVALAERDDWSPTWLLEGTAEYVARAAATTAGQRRQDWSLDLAGRTGLRLRMGNDFYTRGEIWVNYELAGLVCDYLASTQGRDSLWRLMDAFRGRRFMTYDAADALVRRRVGMSSNQLRDAALAWTRA